jgi:hypothetical protein
LRRAKAELPSEGKRMICALDDHQRDLPSQRILLVVADLCGEEFQHSPAWAPA